jgi:hypothetical protein
MKRKKIEHFFKSVESGSSSSQPEQNHPDHDPLPLDQHYYYRSTTKDVTASSAFTNTSLLVARLQIRHCQ